MESLTGVFYGVQVALGLGFVIFLHELGHSMAASQDESTWPHARGPLSDPCECIDRVGDHDEAEQRVHVGNDRRQDDIQRRGAEVADRHIIDVDEVHAGLDIGKHATLHEIHDELAGRRRLHVRFSNRRGRGPQSGYRDRDRWKTRVGSSSRSSSLMAAPWSRR